MNERVADINIRVSLDEKSTPKHISWQASDSSEPDKKIADAFLLSVWDKDDKLTLGIDLWTNDLTIDSMNNFTFQTLMRLAETYKRATGNKEVAKIIHDCALEVGTKILPEKKLN